MPNWKKVITSGSSAALTSVTATAGFTGSLFGTASYATQALSASYAPSTPAFPYTGSAIISGSLGITGSLRILGNLAQGSLISASGLFSHAEGFSTQASDSFAHAEGYQTRAVGEASHAEGSNTLASGQRSHAEGYYVTASGFTSHAEGVQTIASGNYSHAEGNLTQAIGSNAHAEGLITFANGSAAHAEGSRTYADGDVSHAEGQYTATMEVGAHAEGLFTTAGGIRLINVAPISDYFTQTEVYVQGDVLSQYPNSVDVGKYIHFLVPYTTQPAAPADPTYDVVNTTILSSSYDSGTNSTTLTIPTMSNYASLDATSGAMTYVFLENIEESQTWNAFYGSNAHAEGYFTTATGRYSHAEGYISYAFGQNSHAEGIFSTAYGTGSHAEGSTTLAGRGDTYLIDTANSVINGSTEIVVNSKYGDLTGEFGPGQAIQYYDQSGGASGIAMISSSIWSSPNTIIGTYGASISGTGGSIARADTISNGDYETGGISAHAEGYRGKAFSDYSHAEGNQTIASGVSSHAEGNITIAYAAYSHAEGRTTQTLGDSSHAEGNSTVACAAYSHAEGEASTAGGWGLQVDNVSSGVFSVESAGDVTSYFTNGTQIVLVDDAAAYGSEPTAYTFTVDYSTWDGTKTIVTLTDTSLTIGNKVTIGLYGQPQAFNFVDVTYGNASHAAGTGNVTIGDYSYAGGDNNIALGWLQHVVGKFNQTSSKAGAFIIGNGSEGGGRNNLMLAYDNRVEVTGSVMASMGFTGSLLGTAATASFLLGSVATASFATTAETASFLLGTAASATSASVVRVTNNISTNATYYPTFVSSTTGFQSLNVDSTTFTWNPNTETLTAANFAGNASSATSATTATTATNAGTATNADKLYNAANGDNATKYILFSAGQNDYFQGQTASTITFNPTSNTLSTRTVSTNTSLVSTGSTILSGSTTIFGNVTQTGSLFVTSSQVTVGQFVGSQNGYVEFSLRNTSTGNNASGDIAVYADNGTATTNFIDMGINSSTHAGAAYDGTFLGGKNDAYLFNDGGNLFVGNATSTSISKSLFLFADPAGTIAMTITGSRIGFNKSSSLNANVDISGSTIISGSLRGNVILPTITTNTASLDFSIANFFTCSLANGVTTHISASNYGAGQTVNILINQASAGTGKISFPGAFKSGSLYTGSAVANAVDIVTFITFDTTNIYLSAIRNLK